MEDHYKLVLARWCKCGKDFPISRIDREYCSNKCTNRYSMADKRAKVKAKKIKKALILKSTKRKVSK